ncbi:ribose-phosphate pyrophosphokinase [Striga asiatica]|uniref:ribose-phosphate diphosphokinase n=1 Tax=Striga asiatica TaxID=4170 RepID=A0A5A7P726_STRAF|nr:ribose-phosphate pyrophosphokinase [Striga asiatica]
MAATSLVPTPAKTPTPFRPYRRSSPAVNSADPNSRPNSLRTSCAANIVNGSPTALEQASKKPWPKFFESTIPTENAASRNRIKLFSGSANPALSQEIASDLGVELGKVKRKRFADGEIYFQLEESVRGCDVYLLQPTCPPVNDNLMELKIMIETCWSSSAKSITAVQSREPITARIAARDISRANHVLVCDIHSLQSIGYFDIPVDHVQCEPVILDYLASKGLHSSNMVVVSPDVGGVARARAFAKKLGDAPLAIVDKRRHGHNIAEVMNLIGDVRGKVAILVDDMIDTAGTITKGAELLHKEGAKEVYACCTHAVFSPPAIERLSSGLFQEVIVTNTIPVADENYFPQLTVLSTATLLAETIWRLHNEYSVSSIFR